ncbi:MAG: hypothetical protein OXL96_00465 [Candidatus Poribacteria bacterium]|nr:hypothetical protein [Candidatus Poribacteria bacterium]
MPRLRLGSRYGRPVYSLRRHIRGTIVLVYDDRNLDMVGWVGWG